MRVCLDTNILISFLLAPSSDGPPSRVVRECIDGAFDLVVSDLVIEELTRKISTKSYLMQRISPNEAHRFERLVRGIASVKADVTEFIPAVTASRDPDDDYLIALSVVEGVDYLVSGDKDLLALGNVMNVRIVSPADFLLLLDSLRN